METAAELTQILRELTTKLPTQRAAAAAHVGKALDVVLQHPRVQTAVLRGKSFRQKGAIVDLDRFVEDLIALHKACRDGSYRSEQQQMARDLLQRAVQIVRDHEQNGDYCLAPALLAYAAKAKT